MASIFCSPISRRAFSSRLRRSAAVIGLAFDRIEASASMLGGSGPVGAAPPRARCAETRIAGRPAARPVNQRKDRREIITVSVGKTLPPPARPHHGDAELVVPRPCVVRLAGIVA